MNVFDAIAQGMQNFGAALPGEAPQVGVGQMPQRRMEVSPSDPFQMLLQQRQQQFENIRSPMVRRTVGGDIVDESAPTGIDWLRSNAGRGQTHSWEQPQVARQIPQREQVPMDIRQGKGVRAAMGPYGGGFAVEKGSPFQPQAMPDVRLPEDGPRTVMSPMLPQERAVNSQNVMDAFNFAMMNPDAPQVVRDSVAASAPPEGGTTSNSPFPAEPTATPQPQPQPAPTPAAQSIPRAGQPWEMFSPLYPQGEANVVEGAMQPMQDQGYQAVYGDRPAMLPAVGRQAALNASTLWDVLANSLWRSGANRGDTTASTINWLMQGRENEPAVTPPQSPPPPTDANALQRMWHWFLPPPDASGRRTAPSLGTFPLWNATPNR